MTQVAGVATVRLGVDALSGEHVAQQLALAVAAHALHGAFHPTVIAAGEEIARTLCLVPEGERGVCITVGGGSVLADGREVWLTEQERAELVRACGAHAIHKIAIASGVEAVEMATFIDLLSEKPRELSGWGGLPAALVRSGVHRITCETGSLADRQEGGGRAAESSLLRTCATALEVIHESAQQARVGRVLNASAARALASELTDNVIEDRAKLLGLLSMQRRDEYTFQHSLNICLLALALGMAVGLDRGRLQELGLAALLHDVGKSRVPLEILRKPGPLDEREFDLIKQHPVDGAVYLSQQPGLPAAAAVVAFRHHLRHDQRGYPALRWRGPSDAYSLIVGIADAYEALTSDRPYRRTLGPEEALRVMRETPPGQFEPRLLGVFAEMVRRSRAPGSGVPS
ncbi:MAG: HD-GYP domain-containing protein [Armatimonadota bacterium]